MKGIAIGLSNNSKEILKRLKKTEFVKDIYIAGSSKEDGKENEKPLYRQINGNWIIYFNKENKLILSNQEEVQEEIFLQLNSKLPELTSDKWKYPSHKVNIVHSVPCCKTLIIKHLKLQGIELEF